MSSSIPAPPIAPAPPKVDPTYAWSLAVLPLVGLLVTVLAPASIAGYVWIGVVAIGILLATLDQKRLEAAGVRVSAGWVFLIPVYLIQRTRAAHSTPAIPVVWFASFLLSILVAVAVTPSSYSFKGPDVAAYLKQDLHAQYGPGRINVTCPDFSGSVGQTATCTATDNHRTVKLLVTVTDGGHYTYSVAP